MRRLLLGLRSFVFYCLYAGFTTVFSLLAVCIVMLLPYRQRLAIILLWNRFVLAAAKYVCGIHYRIHGLENLPTGSYVALAKHQSAWETFLLLLVLRPVSIILKKELLNIPGFGWGLRMLKPIPIDRDNPRVALRQIQETGLQRLQQENMPVLVFPEGTRIAPGKTGRYARSGASLAVAANVPLVFIAHNAGYFWPSSHMMKYPGTIDLYISEPVSTEGRSAAELTKMAEAWIESHVNVPQPTPEHFR